MIVLGIRGGERLSGEQFLARLKAIYQIIRQSKTLEVALETVGEGLLDILGVRLFTVYQCVENGKERLAIYRGGDTEYNSLNEIRVHFSATSVAGYVALSQRSILINDVKDTSELVDIHPRLQFDRRFSDERGCPIKPMIAVPIKDEVMLGVLQLINFEGDPSFDSSDLKRAAFVSQMLARQFRESLQSNGGPFDQLVKQGSLSSRDLADAQANASLRGASVSSVLMDNYSLSAEAIGKSLAHHYRVPFMA
jgi:GAF domain-containing protein